MSDGDLRSRIGSQFGDRTERADIWRALGLVLETEAFLNLGYSAWYQPHALGEPQRRLATHVGATLTDYLDRPVGTTCLDLGAGRGGPAVHLSERYGLDVTGLDLVAHNAHLARDYASEHDVELVVVIGDATTIPIRTGGLGACTAIDALVYLPERQHVFDEIARVLEPGGVVVLTDLFTRAQLDATQKRAVAAFAEAWDMPYPGTLQSYERGLREAGLRIRRTDDLSPHSLGRFRFWTTLFRLAHAGAFGRVIDGVLEHWELDPATLRTQIGRAHDALPALRHGLIVADKPV